MQHPETSATPELTYRYSGQSATVTGMFSEADDALFRKILYNKTRVLHSYLPDRPEVTLTIGTF